MLLPPDLPDKALIACVRERYGLPAEQVIFLPLGADLNTAVYRVEAGDEQAYFFKLRRGVFDPISVALPSFLAGEGIRHVIAPLAARSGRLWAGLGPYKTILYPFVEGRDGYALSLPDRSWPELGAALRRVHTVALPAVLARRIRRETFSPSGRDLVRASLERAAGETFAEPIAARLAAFLRAKRDETLDLVERADRLARVLLSRPPGATLCHSDIHAGNVLIAAVTFYIVDWDEPILAPKERDLMSIGAGLMGGWRSPGEEESLFYQGYGDAPVDPVALAYYRYERIIQDIAVDSRYIFSGTGGRQDREQCLGYLTSNYEPGHTIDIAYRSDRIHPAR